MGRRFCHNCIIIITESEIQSNTEITFKDFYKKQEKSFKSKRNPDPKKSFYQDDHSSDIIDSNQDVQVINPSSPRQDFNFCQGGNFVHPFHQPAYPPAFQPVKLPGYAPAHPLNYPISYPALLGHAPYISSPDKELEQVMKLSQLTFKKELEKSKLLEQQELEEIQKVIKLSEEEEKAMLEELSTIEREFKLIAEMEKRDQRLREENEYKEEADQQEPLIELSSKPEKNIVDLLPKSLRESVYPNLEAIPCVTKDPKLEYKLIKQLATGGSGIIYIGQKIQTEEYYAIKIIESKTDQEETLIKNEVILTMNSVHPNIIKYHEYYYIKSEFWIIEELMTCSLADMILDLQGQIPENLIAFILKEIISGIYFLHSQKRIHRDIKSDNILINQQGEIKVGDLGFATQLDRKRQIRNTFAGTLLWMPPEILSQQSYGMKIDVWSLGIVAYELAHGEPPHYRDGQQRIIGKILEHEPPRLENPSKWSTDFNHFLDRCLVKDADLRANSKELMNHPFISNCSASGADFQSFFNSWAESR